MELPGYEIRFLSVDDAAALAVAYTLNREHLAPWAPRRSPEFFTEAGQLKDMEISKLPLLAASRTRGSSGTATTSSAGST